MQYRVMGQNRQTGARQIQEFEAESKAAAERKATQSGMSVNRVEEVADTDAGDASTAGTSSGRRRRKQSNLVGWVLFLLVAGAMFAYVNWKNVKLWIGM